MFESADDVMTFRQGRDLRVLAHDIEVSDLVVQFEIAASERARRVALQLIQNTIVCAPDGLREVLRSMTRMQLIRTLAAWRPDLTAYRDVEAAYRITFKSLPRLFFGTLTRPEAIRPCRRGFGA